MSETPNTEVVWRDGLTKANVEQIEKGMGRAEGKRLEGERKHLESGYELDRVLSRLKGDRARFAAVASEFFGASVTRAYELAQAARAHAAYAVTVTEQKVDPVTVPIDSWVRLSRYAADPEDKAEVAKGRKIIETEVKSARKSGRKPMGYRAIADAVSAEQSGASGEATGTEDERKIGRIANKYRDDYRTVFVTGEAVRIEKGPRAQTLYLAARFAEWGSNSGALTPLALAVLDADWNNEVKAADQARKAAERKAAREAAKQDAALAGINAVKPEKRSAKSPAAPVAAK